MRLSPNRIGNSVLQIKVTLQIYLKVYERGPHGGDGVIVNGVPIEVFLNDTTVLEPGMLFSVEGFVEFSADRLLACEYFENVVHLNLNKFHTNDSTTRLYSLKGSSGVRLNQFSSLHRLPLPTSTKCIVYACRDSDEWL
jgi:hypothetical protein